MANNCQACEELRNDAPAFVTNGVTNAVCTSLKNNTGLSTTNGNDNAEDLQNAIDCLIGNMESELAAYDVCDWKDFMRLLIPNLYNTLTAMLCGDTGQWTKLADLECQIKYLFNGASFRFGEQTTGTESHVVAGYGVSYQVRSTFQPNTSDVTLAYIAGGFGRLSGSLAFYTSQFTDVDGRVRSGNATWGTTGITAAGGELCYEVRIKKSEFPQIKTIFPGQGHETGGGAYHTSVSVFTAGQYAFGQHGSCDIETGQSLITGNSQGHLVPDGWIYVQMRVTYIDEALSFTNHSDGRPNSAWYTPMSYVGFRMNRDEIDC